MVLHWKWKWGLSLQVLGINDIETMKKIVFLAALATLAACTTSQVEETDYTAFVDPFIGTGGHGHTHPGAMVPHGMIQPGPDTRIHGWDACPGYYYEDDSINGFSHTRLIGMG